ncbi:hypothetical protein BC831DRAFT_468957 [Entophlyctis helioformis]|nr:hypothetical protein BC831DRAFT_468957 [Entophlyctis helioformis]
MGCQASKADTQDKAGVQRQADGPAEADDWPFKGQGGQSLTLNSILREAQTTAQLRNWLKSPKRATGHAGAGVSAAEAQRLAVDLAVVELVDKRVAVSQAAVRCGDDVEKACELLVEYHGKIMELLRGQGASEGAGGSVEGEGSEGADGVDRQAQLDRLARQAEQADCFGEERARAAARLERFLAAKSGAR